jgi:preprotein translocase subunit SecD
VRRNVIVLTITVVLILGWFGWTLFHDDRPVLGLDLQGGTSIVLAPVQGSDLGALDTAVEIIRNRVDGLGIAEPDIGRQGNNIVVDLPGVKDADNAQRLVGKTAELRFRPVLGAMPFSASANSSTTTSSSAASTTTGSATSTTVKGSTTTTTAVDTGAGTCHDGKDATPPEGDTAEAKQVILPDRDKELCYVLGEVALIGKSVSTAKARINPSNAQWEVAITFKNDDFVNEIAQPFVNQQVAITLDQVVESAPTIEPGITGREVTITSPGGFKEGDAKDLALVLRYGALPVQLVTQTSANVSPTLGKDQLNAGIVAGAIGIGLIALYMIFFYRLLGVVVWLGLALTALIFFSLTTWLSTSRGLTLTLAGVIGLIVSVGVTVDSYVVYFERLKDEVRTGKTVRSSVDVGFTRAFRTIVAADLVSLLGAVILYLLAAGSVRGFALFLAISTVIDLVIAYFIMHPVVSLMARRPELVRMRGIGIGVGLDVPEARA